MPETDELTQDLMHDLRKLSEKHFGNETYGRYLMFNHELQSLLKPALRRYSHHQTEQSLYAIARDLAKLKGKSYSENKEDYLVAPEWNHALDAAIELIAQETERLTDSRKDDKNQ